MRFRSWLAAALAFPTAALAEPAERPAPAAAEASDPSALASLTERQRAVFALLAEGCPTKTIAPASTSRSAPSKCIWRRSTGRWARARGSKPWPRRTAPTP